jgi:hypothetical protein
VSDRHIPVAVRLGKEFRGSGRGGLPVLNLDRILDDLLLAVQAVAAVLLLGFLEAVERPFGAVFVQVLKNLFVGLLRFFVGRTFEVFLGLRGGQGAG